MLNDIYILSETDCDDFKKLNALPENNRGPQVLIMSYLNDSSESIVRVDLTGAPLAKVPAGFIFSSTQTVSLWLIVGNLVMVNGQLTVELDENNNPAPVVFDGSGDAVGILAKCASPGPTPGFAGTLTNILTPSPDVASITNPDSATLGGDSFYPCVDKTTIDNPLYQPWADAMENNQPISTREVILIGMAG